MSIKHGQLSDKRQKRTMLQNQLNSAIMRYQYLQGTFRSSHREVFLGKGVLKIYSKVTGKHPCRSVISIKLHVWAINHPRDFWKFEIALVIIGQFKNFQFILNRPLKRVINSTDW